MGSSYQSNLQQKRSPHLLQSPHTYESVKQYSKRMLVTFNRETESFFIETVLNVAKWKETSGKDIIIINFCSYGM
jgi:hypothetical protein